MDGRRKLKYSVIIPVYNSEKTIRKCLDSLLYQIPEDFVEPQKEIIKRGGYC